MEGRIKLMKPVVLEMHIFLALSLHQIRCRSKTYTL